MCILGPSSDEIWSDLALGVEADNLEEVIFKTFN
jgi:hypothetical protein